MNGQEMAGFLSNNGWTDVKGLGPSEGPAPVSNPQDYSRYPTIIH